MKLYHRTLQNKEELLKERAALLREKKRLEAEDIFSLEAIVGKDSGSLGTTGMVSALIGMLPVSNPIVGLLLQQMPNLVNRLTKGTDFEPSKIVSNITDKIKGAGKDVAFGYLKYKAAELSLKGVKYLISKRNERVAATKRSKVNNTDTADNDPFKQPL